MKKIILILMFFLTNFIFAHRLDEMMLNKLQSADYTNCKNSQCLWNFIVSCEKEECEKRKQELQNSYDEILEVDIVNLDIDDEDKVRLELEKSFVTKDFSNLKSMLDKNPNLINQDLFLDTTKVPLAQMWATQSYDAEHLYNVLNLLLSYKPDLNSGIKNEKHTLFGSLIVYPFENKDRIKISDMLLKNGLNINKQSVYLGKKHKYPESSVLSIALMSDNFEMFSYYLKNGVIDDVVLFFIFSHPMYKYGDELSLYWKNGIDENYEKLINSLEFKQAQNNGIKYLQEYLKYRKLNEEIEKTLISSVKYVAFTNNLNALKILIDNGILENEKARNIFVNFAKNYDRNEILDLINNKTRH
ncbi:MULTISPECIES: hypothetical protein [unclassified Campylobacter]|uniref:hypothetical protein n=1 Tax=unclassified Campylobacter TaxID=2593542 RepID=UPI0022E9F274|nr:MULTISPECIES: hypothetical protein [unclassified Campylobacter]MDA3063068.1 hypothetical protein [Campylobacter sp. JMF_14 EL1]MDA3072630.1 hypothetical protein [Campylobacter sp. JMF_10 EL2]